MPSLPMTPRQLKFSWAASLLGGCVAIAGAAFFGTLVANLSMFMSMAGGMSAEQANATLMTEGMLLTTMLAPLLSFMAAAAGGYVAARLGSARALAQAAVSSLFPLLFLAVMYFAPGSHFGSPGAFAVAVLAPVVASLAGGYLYAKRHPVR